MLGHRQQQWPFAAIGRNRGPKPVFPRLERIEVRHDPIAFLLEHACRYLTRDPTLDDVLSTFAGLRPLVRPPKDRGSSTKGVARDHLILTSPSGLISVLGGKWTTYRKIGEDTVDLAEQLAGMEPKPSVTAELRLRGAAV